MPSITPDFRIVGLAAGGGCSASAVCGSAAGNGRIARPPRRASRPAPGPSPALSEAKRSAASTRGHSVTGRSRGTSLACLFARRRRQLAVDGAMSTLSGWAAVSAAGLREGSATNGLREVGSRRGRHLRSPPARSVRVSIASRMRRSCEITRAEADQHQTTDDGDRSAQHQRIAFVEGIVEPPHDRGEAGDDAKHAERPTKSDA